MLKLTHRGAAPDGGRSLISTNSLLSHAQPFNGPFYGTTHVSRYQKGKTNLDFTEARDSEWQWHQLGHMQVCTSLQTDNHASTPPLSFLQAGCPSCRPTNSVKALNALCYHCSVILCYIQPVSNPADIMTVYRPTLLNGTAWNCRWRR